MALLQSPSSMLVSSHLRYLPHWVLQEHSRVCKGAYIVVRFFILYLARISSIEGAAPPWCPPCCVARRFDVCSFRVVLRAGRAIDRVHDAHIHSEDIRAPNWRSCEGKKDIAAMSLVWCEWCCGMRADADWGLSFAAGDLVVLGLGAEFGWRFGGRCARRQLFSSLTLHKLTDLFFTLKKSTFPY